MPAANLMDPPGDEAARLAGLHALMVLDSAPEPLFDSIVQMASDICGAPIALLSLVDTRRQWFKANVGLPGVCETSREVAFCAQAIDGNDLFEVPDATQDSRFADNPLVTGAPDIRFYAGAPLVLPRGERIGTLCVIDQRARSLDDAQRNKLQALAAMASQALVMRRELIERSLKVRSEYEIALAQSETRYRSLVEQQIELVSLAEPDGRLIYVNAAYAHHFGLTPQQMIDRNLFDYVAESDRPTVRARIAEVLTGGATQIGENRMRAADGTERWLAWTNTLQFDDRGGRLLHSVGRDVTERKLAELALQTSQSFLVRTGRVAGVGGWELDLASGTLTWSDETRRIHGVASDFVPTLDNAITFYPAAARASIEHALQAALDHGTAWDLELPLTTATGRHIWVRAVGEVEAEAGCAKRLVGAFQDVTERKQLEQRVADSERFTRYVADSLPVRIAYVDSQRRYRFVNHAHCASLGLARDDIIGCTRTELMNNQGTDDALVEQRIDAALSGRRQHFEFEDAAGGALRRIEAQLLPDVADSGEVRGYFSIGVDITERANAERSLRELTAIIENTTDYIVQADRDGYVNYMNPSVRQALGLAADAPVARLHFSDFNTPQTNRLFQQVIVPTARSGQVWIGNTDVYVEGRRPVPVSHMVIAHRDPQGRIARFSSIMRDISAAVEAEAESKRQTAVLRSLAESIPSSVAVLGQDGRYQFVNCTFEQWCGLPRDQILGRKPTSVHGESEFERRRPWIERAKAGETVSFELEYPGRRPAHQLISYVPLRSESGVAGGYVVVAQDVTQQRLEQRRLLDLSHRDGLTGLLNRTGFEDSLRRQLQHDDADTTLAVLYIDLDHFKPVNDQHGHPAGDRVLQLFAKRLENVVRRPTRWRGWAATSSRSACSACASRPTRTAWPARCCVRRRPRSSSAPCCCSSTRASASRSPAGRGSTRTCWSSRRMRNCCGPRLPARGALPERFCHTRTVARKL